MHADKSDDLRGKLEADESPEQRARREVVEESVRAIDTSSQTAAPYRYSAHEDSYCWVCGGPVTKRHCKITCSRCGFMRDCSDP